MRQKPELIRMKRRRPGPSQRLAVAGQVLLSVAVVASARAVEAAVMLCELVRSHLLHYGDK